MNTLRLIVLIFGLVFIMYGLILAGFASYCFGLHAPWMFKLLAGFACIISGIICVAITE